MVRDKKIDILKAIGAILIILAHVSNSPLILQLRNFDVPLMVMISGYLAVDSLKKSESNMDYYRKRFIRLVVPTYIFLIFFFLITRLVTYGKPYPFDIKMILKTFLLLDGIGYVWIIRVYLICAIVTPILIYLENKFSKLVLVVSATAIYCIYEICYFYFGDTNILIKYIINYLVPYSVILFIGMEIKRTENKMITILTLLFLSCFIVLGVINYKIHGHFIPTQETKYPPRLYYLSYALMMSLLLFRILNNKQISNRIYNPIISFISRNSLWIYLWHILYIYILSALEISWMIRFIAVLLCTLTTVCIQQKIIGYLESKNVNKNILKIFKG